MSNYDIARDAVDTSINSAGSAMKENEKFLESMDGKLAQLKANFETLSTGIFNSDFLKGAIDAGSAFLDVLSKIIEALGVFGTIGAGAGIAMLIKSLGRPKQVLLISDSKRAYHKGEYAITAA